MTRNQCDSVLILGSSGFIGKNLSSYIKGREVICSTRETIFEDLKKSPKTVFNLIGYGGYRSHNQSGHMAYHANFILLHQIMESLPDDCTFINAGSSSEYGSIGVWPNENTALSPDSHYSVSKAAASQLIWYYGKTRRVRCANLRIYHAYGPHESSERLVPTVISGGMEGKLPEFVRGDISHDFIHVDDVCRAFLITEERLKEKNYGESFNIGTGQKTKISEVAELARETFGIEEEPRYTLDRSQWNLCQASQASTYKSKELLGFEAKKDFRTGFLETVDWYKSNG
jgi:polyisoprenyl-phosphate glycosyltransferase